MIQKHKHTLLILTVLAALLLFVAFVNTANPNGASTTVYCGDKHCNGSENHNVCPADCAVGEFASPIKTTAGSGQSFSINSILWPNLILTSSQQIKISANAQNDFISLTVSAETAATTTISFAGLTPSATYNYYEYTYADMNKIKSQFTTDAQGAYSWTAPVSTAGTHILIKQVQ